MEKIIMNSEEYINLHSKIVTDNIDLLITKKDTGEILSDYCFVTIDDGKIDEVCLTDGTCYLADEVSYNKYVLNIPGIGGLIPGTRVIYKDKDYVLQFGWHTNISNQTIYSWYLQPLDVTVDWNPKTLYKEMINEIDVVHFR